ncbi:MAG: sigma 54-interacting transcriptional regulator [Clostridiales bacterium]|nr:sigma 54-interacting transcriptional regulator [Clostridiales bacterium]
MIGKNVKDIYGLTDDTSKVMRVLHTGVPIRDYLMSFVSVATGKRHLWLYSAYPLIVDGSLIGAITVYKPFSNVKSLVDEYEGTEKRKSDFPASVQTSNLFTFDDIIYASAEMEETVKLCRKVAKSESSVLLVGETGTGKQMFAESIHSASSQNSKPFISVNCAAIPDTLLESVLFGVTKGAYTGAVEKPGLFEQSSDGTIFLDEIQALSPVMQAKLLRVLEYKVVRRVGSNKEIKVNPRIITAMNVNPLDYMKAGKLKPDLFYRIAVVTIRIPPLRERTSDIPILVNHFIKKANSSFSRRIERCSDQVLQHFFKYDWPGNVRELQHIIEHAAVVMSEFETSIQMDHLPAMSMQNTPVAVETKAISGFDIEKVVKNMENGSLNIDYKSAHDYALNEFNRQFNRFFIKHALEVTNYNISKAAKKLNISRQHLHKLIQQFDIR